MPKKQINFYLFGKGFREFNNAYITVQIMLHALHLKKIAINVNHFIMNKVVF
jgi:hypothetical protein